MAGGPEAWPEPEDRPKSPVREYFAWEGYFAYLRPLIIQSGDPLTVYGRSWDLERFADLFSLRREHVLRSDIPELYRFQVPSDFARWSQMAPETWRMPGGQIVFYTPDNERLFVQTSSQEAVARLESAGAIHVRQESTEEE